MPNEQEDVKFLKYKTRILAVNTGDQPDRLTHDIVVPTFRGYAAGDRIPAGTLLSAIIEKEFNSAPPTPKVTISITGSGTTVPAAGSHDVTYGGSFTITSATPASGSRLGSVTVDGTAVTLPHTLTNVTSDHTVRVVFEELSTFTVTPQAGSNGSISPATAQSFNENDPVNITFTATPNTGYQVDKWQVNGVDDQVGGDSFTFTLSAITANQTVKVLFKEVPVIPTYTITGQVSGGHGSISPLSAGEYEEGANVGAKTFTATPDSGYRVKKWTVNDVDQSVTTTSFELPAITGIDKNYVVKVEFEEIPAVITYNIVGEAGANGTISPSGVAQTHDEHTASTAQLFTATPDTGYEVDRWLRNGTAISGETGTTYTLPAIADMTEDVTIKVEFKEVVADTYTVTVTDNTPSSLSGAGTISPAAGSHTVNVGTDTTVTVTANSGFKVKTFTVDGSDVTSPYTITGAIKDQTVVVVVEFEELTDLMYNAYVQRTRSQGAMTTTPTLADITLGEAINCNVNNMRTNGYDFVTPPTTGKTYTQPVLIVPTSLGFPTNIEQSSIPVISTFHNDTIVIDGVTYTMIWKNSLINSGQATYNISWS